jgi:hypothetical protein
MARNSQTSLTARYKTNLNCIFDSECETLNAPNVFPSSSETSKATNDDLIVSRSASDAIKPSWQNKKLEEDISSLVPPYKRISLDHAPRYSGESLSILEAEDSSDPDKSNLYWKVDDQYLNAAFFDGLDWWRVTRFDDKFLRGSEDFSGYLSIRYDNKQKDLTELFSSIEAHHQQDYFTSMEQASWTNSRTKKVWVESWMIKEQNLLDDWEAKLNKILETHVQNKSKISGLTEEEKEWLKTQEEETNYNSTNRPFKQVVYYPVTKKFIRDKKKFGGFSKDLVKEAEHHPGVWKSEKKTTGRSSISEGLVGASFTDIPVMYTKRPKANTCMVTAIASVLFHYGQLSGREICQRAAGIIHHFGIQLSFDSNYNSNVHRLVVSTLRDCKCGLIVRKDRVGSYFNPLDERDSTHCPPVYGKLKVRGNTMNHCVAFCNGLIFDPEFSYAVAISKHNLDAICGGPGCYQGLYWSKRLVLDVRAVSS